MYDSAEVAKKIKCLAQEKNIHLKDMLLTLELGKTTLSNMYKGSMLKADSLARIADYLGCSVDYLLGRTDDAKTSQKLIPEATDQITHLPSKNLAYQNQPDIHKAIIGRRIKSLREKVRISQAELGTIIGIDASNIGTIENGKVFPRSDKLFKIATYFNVSCDWLLTGKCKGGEEYADTRDMDFGETSVLNLYRSLPEDAQKDVNDFIHYKLHQLSVAQNSKADNQKKTV